MPPPIFSRTPQVLDLAHVFYLKPTVVTSRQIGTMARLAYW
jgi:hypothetical protein